MEAGAEELERSLKALDRVLLLGVVEALVIDTGNAQHHAQVAALGQECRLVPEAVQVDVVCRARQRPSTA